MGRADHAPRRARTARSPPPAPRACRSCWPGVVQPGQRAFFEREIAPHLDGERVRFAGEVGGAAKRALFAGARALLMPIRWREPFGMVMVEALSCGTPVIAFPEGAAPSS